MGKSFEVSGAKNKSMELKCNIVGQNFTKCDFTESLSLPVVEDAVTKKTKLYIDDSGANLGTTQKSATLTAFNWKPTEGVAPEDFCDGELWFSAITELARQIEPSLQNGHFGLLSLFHVGFLTRTFVFCQVFFYSF